MSARHVRQEQLYLTLLLAPVTPRVAVGTVLILQAIPVVVGQTVQATSALVNPVRYAGAHFVA